MTTSRTGSLRGARALLAALALAGGLAATGASAAPGLPLAATPRAEIAPVQYWGDHGGWGHRRHDDGPRYGYHGHHHHDGWGHRRRHHGWDHHRGWGHRHHHHHHHRGHGRYDY